MPLRYCSLHEQVFVQRKHKWIDFSREKIELLKNFFELHHALGVAAAHDEVVEDFCDECDEIARPLSKYWCAV